MSVIGLDFETFYSKKLRYSVRTMVDEQYCRHELFHPYLITVCDGTTTWAGEPKDFNWGALDGRTLVSNNAGFDSSVYYEMVRRGWAPKVNFKGWHCAADLTSYICNLRSLDQSVEFLLGEHVSKEARATADHKKWPNDFTAEERDRMIKYARRDPWYTWRLWDKYSPQWPEWERRLSDLTIHQKQRGVQINRGLLDRYLMQSHEMKIATEKLLPWLSDEGDDSWDEFNTKPTSTKCIAEQCRRNGIPCPPVKEHEGEEAYLEWENLYAPANPWIPALSSWRSINKIYKTFQLVKTRLRDDNTLPFGLKYFGAHTGRWSGDAQINFQNMRKRPIICLQNGLMEPDDRKVDAALKYKKEEGGGEKYPSWVKYAIDFRHLIIPRPGKKMILSDLAQIEPRILAWFTGNTKKLDLVRAGMSMYEAHARTNMGYTGPPLDKSDPVYALAKAQELALGYQAGWEKFIVMAYDYTQQDFTKDDPEFIDVLDPQTGEMKQVSGYGSTAKKIVETYRKENNLTVTLWNKLEMAFRSSVGNDFVMTLPSGRRMTYRRVRCGVVIEADKATGKPRRKVQFTALVGGRPMQFYGGKLTENLVQAAARDVFAIQVLRLEDAGIPTLFTVHDEAICEVDESVSAKDVEEQMSFTPEWMPGLPVKAEAKEVEHYEK